MNIILNGASDSPYSNSIHVDVQLMHMPFQRAVMTHDLHAAYLHDFGRGFIGRQITCAGLGDDFPTKHWFRITRY